MAVLILELRSMGVLEMWKEVKCMDFKDTQCAHKLLNMIYG